MAIFRPGEDPIGNLATALNDREVLGGDTDDAEMNRSLLEATLHRSARGLAECVRQARLPEHDCVLVLADQFEELFRFKGNRRIKDSRESALAFVKLLLEGAHAEDIPLYVVITMRSDFIGNCTEFPGLVEAINDGQYLVPRMTREERRQAIEGPVAVGGGQVSARLVTRLLNDVGDDPDQLPILQHALMRAWDYWAVNRLEDESLDLRHYEAIGTLKEALSLHAEEAYNELPGADSAAICEKLFQGLTDMGSDSRGVRRPIRLADACELTGGEEKQIFEIVECFRKTGRTFLMPPPGIELTSDSILDISHESLMRTWKRLIQWVDEEARSSQIYLRLARNAALYQEGKAALWRDPELQLAVNWYQETGPTPIWAQRYDPSFERALLFLQYSEKDRDREVAEKERQRQRQLRWAKRLAIILGSAAVLTLFFGLYAITQKVEADQQRDEAQNARQEAEKNEDQAERNAEQAKRNAERASQSAERARRSAEEAEAERLRAEKQRQQALTQKKRAEEQEQIAHQQRQLALEKEQQAKRLQHEAEDLKEEALEQKQLAEVSEAEARRLSMLSLARATAIQSTRLRQDDQRELAMLLALQAYRFHLENGGQPQESNIYNALSLALHQLRPELRRILRHHEDAVRALVVTPDSSWAASAGDDGKLQLFALDGSSPRLLADLGREIRSLAVTSSGRLAAGGVDGSIRLLEADSSSTELQVLRGHKGAVSALDFSGDGRYLASTSAKEQVGLWDLEAAKAKVRRLDGPSERVQAVAWSPDGRRLVAGSAQGVTLWRLSPGQPGLEPGPPLRLETERRIRSLSWSAAGGMLAAGSDRGIILLWRSVEPGSTPLELVGHLSGVSSLAFSRKPGLLASASLDSSVRLWDVRRSEGEPIELSDPEGWVWSVALSSDGETVLAGGADRSVRLWPTRTEPLALEACRQLSRNLKREEWSEHMPPDVEYELTCPDLEKGLNR